MSTWAQPGRLWRPGRGPKAVQISVQGQFSKTPHTQKSGHPPRSIARERCRCDRRAPERTEPAPRPRVHTQLSACTKGKATQLTVRFARQETTAQHPRQLLSQDDRTHWPMPITTAATEERVPGAKLQPTERYWVRSLLSPACFPATRLSSRPAPSASSSPAR